MAEWLIGDTEDNLAEAAGKAGVENLPCLCVACTKLINEQK